MLTAEVAENAEKRGPQDGWLQAPPHPCSPAVDPFLKVSNHNR